jgi:Ca2+-transporting ATPase
LRKAMIYIAAVHVPIAGLALLPIAFGLPPLLLPVHIALIEMIIDPTCSIAFERTPEEPDIMRHGPRDAAQPIIGRRQLLLALAQGICLLAGTLAVYWIGIAHGVSVGEARALTFVALTAGNLTLVRVNMTRGYTAIDLARRGHGAFWLIAAGALVGMTLALSVPGLRALLHFEAAPLHLIFSAALVGIASSLSFDVLKAFASVREALGSSTANPV